MHLEKTPVTYYNNYMKKYNKNKLKKYGIIILAVIFIVLALLPNGIINENIDSGYIFKSKQTEDGTVSVHFINVGQGDATFVELGYGKCLLIDAGDAEHAERVGREIQKRGYESITYLVATHPHADHVGGMEYIAANFTVENMYLPQSEEAYGTLPSAENTITAETGCVIMNENGIKLRFLSPDDYDVAYDANTFSAVLRMDVNDVSFLFMSDATEYTESQIMGKLDCDILKVAHHGSNTSTSEEFLEYATPEVAVISCGRNNDYGHPTDAVLYRLEKSGAEIYRTDKNGTVDVVTDGKTYSVSHRRWI